jgi:hypothetical protein
MLWPNAPTDASPSIRTAASIVTDNRFISCNLSGDNVSNRSFKSVRIRPPRERQRVNGSRLFIHGCTQAPTIPFKALSKAAQEDSIFHETIQ